MRVVSRFAAEYEYMVFALEFARAFLLHRGCGEFEIFENNRARTRIDECARRACAFDASATECAQRVFARGALEVEPAHEDLFARAARAAGNRSMSPALKARRRLDSIVSNTDIGEDARAEAAALTPRDPSGGATSYRVPVGDRDDDGWFDGVRDFDARGWSELGCDGSVSLHETLVTAR